MFDVHVARNVYVRHYGDMVSCKETGLKVWGRGRGRVEGR